MPRSGASPIAAPDHSVFFGEPAAKSEIAFPRRLSGDVFDQVASKPIVMHTHGFELGRPLVIELGLPGLPAEGLVSHKRLMPAAAASVMMASTLLRVTGSSSARSWIGWRLPEARVLSDDVGVEIAHAGEPLLTCPNAKHRCPGRGGDKREAPTMRRRTLAGGRLLCEAWPNGCQEMRDGEGRLQNREAREWLGL